MEGSLKSATIVIPAYNEEEGIVGLLEAVKKLNLFEKYEFIVVDDGSTDNTAEVAGKYPLRVLRHSVIKVTVLL